MDQRRRLQGVIASLAIEAERGDAAKLGVNQGYQLSLGLPVPLSKPDQQLRNLALLRALPAVQLHLVPSAGKVNRRARRPVRLGFVPTSPNVLFPGRFAH